MPLTKFVLASFLASALAEIAAPLPSQMKAVLASGTPCESGPGPYHWTCISEKTVDVPHPGAGQMLVAMKGASVNLITVELVEPLCKSLPSPCWNGTVSGSTGSGVVVKMGEGNACDGFVVGDEVWMLGGQYAEYAIVPCNATGLGLKPKNLSFVDAGTIPLVGATSLQCLQAANMSLTNLTVVVTRGNGGTGFMGIQLAKALGASRVITAATGRGIDVMKNAGADVVIDYHKEDLFDVLGFDSVDVVFDNFGLPGTADKAMTAIRSGGVFMILSGGNDGKASDHPKSGVRQVPSCQTKEVGTEELDTLAKLFDAGKLQPPRETHTYGLCEVAQAFTWKSQYRNRDDWGLNEVPHLIKPTFTTSVEYV